MFNDDLHQALVDLDIECQLFIHLHYYCGLSETEAGQMLFSSESISDDQHRNLAHTVHKRAMRHLRRTFGVLS